MSISEPDVPASEAGSVVPRGGRHRPSSDPNLMTDEQAFAAWLLTGIALGLALEVTAARLLWRWWWK